MGVNGTEMRARERPGGVFREKGGEKEGVERERERELVGIKGEREYEWVLGSFVAEILWPLVWHSGFYSFLVIKFREF
jgi:hypothetical protein